ncbi:MAG: carbohydrate porin [Chthoniobacterales bacterium]
MPLELVFEATYQAQITPWLTRQPDLQFILQPGGSHGTWQRPCHRPLCVDGFLTLWSPAPRPRIGASSPYASRPTH